MTASKLIAYTDEQLITEYHYLVDCYNDFADAKNDEFAKNMMDRIPSFEAELKSRNLINSNVRVEVEAEQAPKMKAEQQAPSSRAKMRIAVQKFLPLPIIAIRPSVNLKTSNYFLPRSRFISYQNKIRTICRHLKQYNELKENSKILKREKYKETLTNLCAECVKIVDGSVRGDFKLKVLKEPYMAWGTKEIFTINEFDKFLKQFFK